MTKEQALAVVGLGAAGFAVYRATRDVENAAGAYRRRGLSGDVLLLGLLAFVALAASFEQAGTAVKKAKRAF